MAIKEEIRDGRYVYVEDGVVIAAIPPASDADGWQRAQQALEEFRQQNPNPTQSNSFLAPMLAGLVGFALVVIFLILRVLRIV